jgi:hypothetical protein
MVWVLAKLKHKNQQEGYECRIAEREAEEKG